MTRRDADARRIVYVLERFPADTLNFVYNEIRGLEAAGFTIAIHSLYRGGICPEEARDLGARTTTLTPVRPREVLAAWLHYLVHRPAALAGVFWRLPLDNRENRLLKAVKSLGHLANGVQFAWKVRGDADHVHAHFAFKAAAAALVAARLNGTTYSFTAHGSATVVPAKAFSLATKVRFASFVVSVSEFNRRVLAAAAPDVPADRIVINRTGILLDQFPFRSAPPRGARPFGIICVASLYPVKNHPCLLRACGLLAERGLDFRLDLVGSDPRALGEGLRRLAQDLGIGDRVVFHGSVDHGRIAALLETADAAVLTSTSEGVPVSLMEAMARGVPVVGPRVTGVPELVEDGVSGILADPGSPGEFADALERLAADPALAGRLAAAARRTVESAYDMTANARKLAAIFSERLARDDRGRQENGSGPA